jgi:glutaminyl-tRNA synthetase
MSVPPTPSKDFIREIIDEDLSSGKHDGTVTRFPPEPNGYLHIGHAKSICLNFGIAQEYGGRCHLRFDDTNPTKEDVEYVDSIKEDIRWLGFDWGDHIYFASDYFERLHEWAVGLIEGGKAYVDEQSAEEIRKGRGDLQTPGTNSPHRDRPVEESLDLFQRMKAGEFGDGEKVLRAKIDMAGPAIPGASTRCMTTPMARAMPSSTSPIRSAPSSLRITARFTSGFSKICQCLLIPGRSNFHASA